MSQESTASVEITSMGVDNRKLGVWVWLGSEAVFFSALIIVYIVMRNNSVSGPFPRETLNVSLTAINTFILICSSLTMVTALSAIQSGSQRGLWRWLVVTMALGLAFLTGQAIEFTSLAHQGLSLSSNLFGGTFFTLTGFHGAHVLIGVIWIGFVVARALRGGYTQSNHLMVELAGLYWHFVDLVWIIIFTIVYLI
jgi:cytochrome c oxidase subunit 3/cytochrome o ubiquinol oxidase subunit 3